jgi:UDP:flavonoid glycosyltransferase YjiC (YdhE family)
MLGALAHGVPVLVLPHGADQFRNARALQQAHAGLACDPDDMTAVRASLDALLNDPTYSEGARRIAAEVAAMPTPGEVVSVLETLASQAAST